jgi:hypothetical protein
LYFIPDTAAHTNEKRQDVDVEIYTRLQLQTAVDTSE